jgi:hypothetical protein
MATPEEVLAKLRAEAAAKGTLLNPDPEPEEMPASAPARTKNRTTSIWRHSSGGESYKNYLYLAKCVRCDKPTRMGYLHHPTRQVIPLCKDCKYVEDKIDLANHLMYRFYPLTHEGYSLAQIEEIARETASATLQDRKAEDRKRPKKRH